MKYSQWTQQQSLGQTGNSGSSCQLPQRLALSSGPSPNGEDGTRGLHSQGPPHLHGICLSFRTLRGRGAMSKANSFVEAGVLPQYHSARQLLARSVRILDRCSSPRSTLIVANHSPRQPFPCKGVHVCLFVTRWRHELQQGCGRRIRVRYETVLSMELDCAPRGRRTLLIHRYGTMRFSKGAPHTAAGRSMASCSWRTRRYVQTKFLLFPSPLICVQRTLYLS